MKPQPIEITHPVVQDCYERHKEFVGDWSHGEIKEAWLDTCGFLCIKYESGKWWHYRNTEEYFEYW